MAGRENLLATGPTAPAAFSAAARDGDFDALLAVLDPDVELRIDGGSLRADASLVLHKAPAVAEHTATCAKLYPFVIPALVKRSSRRRRSPTRATFSVMAFTVTHGKITRIDTLLDPERLAGLNLSIPPADHRRR